LNALILQSGAPPDLIHDILMKLPNMTEEIADAIIDWIDADDNPRPNGAESATYSGMTPPYRCKNGPLDSIEELLLVRGVTPPPRRLGQPAWRPRIITAKIPLDDTLQQQQLLPLLIDKTTTKSGQELAARINVLTAPKTVLTCLTALGGNQGGLTDAQIQSII